MRHEGLGTKRYILDYLVKWYKTRPGWMGRRADDPSDPDLWSKTDTAPDLGHKSMRGALPSTYPQTGRTR